MEHLDAPQKKNINKLSLQVPLTARNSICLYHVTALFSLLFILRAVLVPLYTSVFDNLSVSERSAIPCIQASGNLPLLLQYHTSKHTYYQTVSGIIPASR